MNAVIQCLINTEDLTKVLSEKAGKRYKNAESRKINIGKELLYLMAAMKSGEYRSVSPANFRNEMIKAIPDYKDYKQEDAHEALMKIISQIEVEIEDKNTHEIGGIFDGESRTCTKCRECGHTSMYHGTYRCCTCRYHQTRQQIFMNALKASRQNKY